MTRMMTQSMAVFAALAMAACGQESSNGLVGQSVKMKKEIARMDVPSITAVGATQASIDVQVCAGKTGLPAGFSLQWMTAADFALGGWPVSDAANLCKASFSGNANLSRYDLAPDECVTVRVGEFLFDNGASTSCGGALSCGTEYVFRAFGHANSDLNRSNFTADLYASTLACGHEAGCTFTQGYWKTHGPVPSGNNEYVWPQEIKDNGLALGVPVYTADQLLAIFDTPASGNGLVALAHQLEAAKLNVANGADGSAVSSAIGDADALIGDLVIPPVGGGFLGPADTSSLTGTLASYNEGAIGPGHCE